METAIVQPEPIVSVIEVIREVPVEVIRTVETIVERLVEVPVEVVKEVEVIKEIIKEVIVDRIVEVEKVVKIPYVDIRYKAPKWAPLVLIAGVLEVSTFLIWLVLK